MGYILPVSNFEYMDYQRRVIKGKREFYHIEKPYKVKLDMKHQINNDHPNFTKEISHRKEFDSQNLINSRNDYQIAIITGKGVLFNESV